MRYDFFIAASPADADVASSLYDALETEGVPVFLDARSVELGERLDEATLAGQRTSRATAVIVTANSEPEFFVREEVARAILWSREHPESHRVIPVLLDPREEPHRWVPSMLRPFVPVDVRAEGDIEGVVRQMRLATQRRSDVVQTIASGTVETFRASQGLLSQLRALTAQQLDALVKEVSPAPDDSARVDATRRAVDLVGLAMLDPAWTRSLERMLSEMCERVEAKPPAASPAPTRITLSGIRGLRNIEIALAPTRDHGALLVLLGENGAGKTTLLRSVALTLADPDVARGMLTRAPAPYVRDPREGARCEVTTTHGTYAIALVGGDDFDRVATALSPRGERPFVVGYGCRRGSALGGQDKPAKPTPAEDLDNLFDDPKGLINAEVWLAQLQASALDDEAARTLFEHVRATLLGMLPGVASVAVRERQAWVTFADERIGTVRWSSLSDGYLTTAGWVVDLMARWIEQQTRRPGTAIPPDFRERMAGFVLLDEIDLHLHPRWQMSVIATARATFPRMHFIVTTHNPLALLSARAGEVRRLERDATSGDIVAVDPGVDPRLLTGTELLRSFFGIDDLYPDEAGRLLRDYQYLSANPFRSEEDDRRLDSMRAELAARGIQHGVVPVRRELDEAEP